MIKKINNKTEKFYQYMGKFFGSRIVEKQTNDRIYDDDKKEWYVYIENDSVIAFVSIQNKVIKNVYCYKEEYLEKLLSKVCEEEKIENSIITKQYIDVYKNCGFDIIDNEIYKNFVMVHKKERRNNFEKNRNASIKC